MFLLGQVGTDSEVLSLGNGDCEMGGVSIQMGKSGRVLCSQPVT